MKAIAPLFALALSACATTEPPKPVVTHIPAPVAVPAVAPLSLGQFRWTVYNRERLQKELRENPERLDTIVALTPQGYRVLARNTAELERYIREQRAVIAYLTRAIEINGER